MLTLDLKDHANTFVELAIRIIDQCYEDDKRMAQLALVRKLRLWGNTTCLSIAYSGQQQKFLEHECCQTKIERTWKGMIQMNLFEQKVKYWLALFCPLFLPTVTFHAIDYKRLPQKRKTEEQKTDQGQVKKQTLRNVLFRWKSAYPKNIENRHVGGRVDDVTLWEGLCYLYTAPKSKFAWNLVSFLAMLLLFSWVLLTDLRPSSQPNSPGTIEYVVMVWICTLIIDEFRQVIERDSESMKYRIRSWFSEYWNKFDTVMFLVYTVAIILRFVLPMKYFEYARIIYSMSLMLFYFRLLQMALVAQKIGPKIIMIYKMLQDLSHFVVVLVIFLLGFGYATQALLTPNQDPHLSVFLTSLHRPHWQLYGWLFINENGDQITNETCYYDGVQGNYTSNDTMVCMDTNMYKWFIPLLTAIYLMIANILLLNLLIAMFSYTFQNVQDNSKTIWRFFRCQVIIEYFERPTMVPPFILLNHVYRIVKFAYRKIKLKYDLRHHGNRSKQEIQNENDERQSHELKVCLNAKDEYKLNSFEMRCMEEYFIKLHQKDVQCIETTVLSNVGRLEGVIQQVQELREAADKDDIPMATEPASSCPTISTQKGQRDTEDKLLQFMSQINERLTKLEEDMKRLV